MCDSPVMLPSNRQTSDILTEHTVGNCSKFYLKQCSPKKFLKKLVLLREYMKMCSHGNQHPWAIKHPFISLYSKYQSLKFICFP